MTCEEARVERVASVALIGRLEDGGIGGGGGDSAYVGERSELAGRARLHEHVAERGCLHGPGEHG